MDKDMAADLYRVAREVAEALAEFGEQYDDMVRGAEEGETWTPPVIAQYEAMMAADRELFLGYLAQGRRWQAEAALSPYQQAVLNKLLADAAAALPRIERLAQLVPTLPTAPEAP
ncbi:MAG TPA: hypothetical protein VGE07_14055 [Herpetosiphonaceae bacterium]